MRRVSLLFCGCAVAFGLPGLQAADLPGVRSVYIFAMSHGMDQYLANRLTNDHIFQVVTDAKSADAVLTDHIGESFEKELDALLPSPEPVKKTEIPAKDDKDKDKSASSDALVMFDSETKLPPVRSTFGASKGTFFLVDPKTHQVIWSVYDAARGFDSKEMDRTASDIVSRLKKDLNPNPKK